MMMWLALPITFAIFLAFRALHQRVGSALLNPVLWTIITSVLVILAFDVNLENYRRGTALFSYLLELSVVALAVPLYKQIHQMKRQLPIMALAIAIGIITASTTASMIAHLLDAPAKLIASLSALSVTTPITLLVTEKVGGINSIAASLVILIGVFGAVAGFSVLKLFGLKQAAAQGVALGGACHAIGTSAAIANNETSAGYASAAMALSALLTPIIVPFYFPWLQSLLA